MDKIIETLNVMQFNKLKRRIPPLWYSFNKNKGNVCAKYVLDLIILSGVHVIESSCCVSGPPGPLCSLCGSELWVLLTDEGHLLPQCIPCTPFVSQPRTSFLTTPPSQMLQLQLMFLFMDLSLKSQRHKKSVFYTYIYTMYSHTKVCMISHKKLCNLFCT